MLKQIAVGAVGMLPRGFIKRIGMMQAKSPMLHRIVVGARSWIQNSGALTIQQGPCAGLKFQPGESNFGYVTGTSEPDTQKAMTDHIRPGDCFWDIGCNVGFMTVLGSMLVGDKGAVYSFDPVPKHTALTEQNTRDNQFSQAKVFQMAISDKAGRARFAVAEIAAQSTLTEAGMTREGSTVIDVATASVDGLIQSEGLRPPNVVKIDVEGAEVDVLKGMVDTLRVHRPIVILDTHGEHMKCAAALVQVGYFVATSDQPDKPIEESQYYCQILATPNERRTSRPATSQTALV